MTEIPEHLLRRSKERRDALGLGGGGDAAPAADAPAGAAAPVPAAASASTEVAPAAAPPPVAAAPPPPPPAPPFVVAAQRRRTIPFWALPVVAILPIWGFIYAGSLATPEEDLSDPELVLGEEVYANCSGCHGANGEGGAGRPLSNGDVLLTFPDIEDHIAWINEGSALVGGAGNPYGDPDRPGGQRISGSDGYGQMAAWGGTLSEEEVRAVARYEREVLSGGEPEGETAAGEGGATAGDSNVAEGSDEGADQVEGGGGEGDAEGSTGDGGADANDAEGGATAGDG